MRYFRTVLILLVERCVPKPAVLTLEIKGKLNVQIRV